MTAGASSTTLPVERVTRAERTRAPYALRLLAIQAAFGAGLIVEVLEGLWTDGPWLRVLFRSTPQASVHVDGSVPLLLIGLLLLIPPILGRLFKAMPWVSVPFVVLVLIAWRALEDPGGALVFLLPLYVATACAFLLTVAERRRDLRWAAWLAAGRDGLWRLAALLAVAISSPAIANRVERGVFEWTFRTTLEGVALSAGILAGALFFVVLTWGTWRLPRIVAERQCKGSILPDAGSDALWFGLLLCASSIVLDLRGIRRSGTFSDALGGNCWLALAATAAFAVVRLRLPPAFRTDIDDNPLWIVFLGGTNSSAKGRRHAALLAALWREGPVTFVSEPNVALKSGGAHLRLARIRGRLEAMFPQRLIHLADWIETLPPPDRWQAVPIRELYARPALWPDFLTARLEANARIVVIADSLPDDAVIDPLRVVLPAGRTEIHLPKAVETDRLRARWSSVSVFPFDGPTSVKSWIGLGGSSTHVDAGRRYLLIDYSEGDEVFVERLRALLDHVRDARNNVVYTYAVLRTSKISAAAAIAQASAYRVRGFGLFAPIVVLFARLGRAQMRARGSDFLWAYTMTLLVPRLNEEHDLLVLEPRTTEVKARERVDAATREMDLKLLDHLIGILPEGGEENPELTFDAASYTGTIRIPSDDLERQVANVAQRILMMDLDAVRVPSIEIRSPTVLNRRPNVYLSYVGAYREFAQSLAGKLKPICHVTDLKVDRKAGQSLTEEIKQFIPRADVIVAIVGPDTAHGDWATFEIEWAQQSRKPILPVFVAPFTDLPMLQNLVPANRTSKGSTLFLADHAEQPGELNDVLRLTAANITKELAVVAPMASFAPD